MTAPSRIARRMAGIVAACALALTIFFNPQAHAKDKAPKGELEHALVGQLVTSKILLGAKARPKGVPYDVTVHTFVDAETGEIAYRAEDLLVSAEVRQGEMQHYFANGTTFRITGIHIKGNRIEIKLEELRGGPTEVKLLMGKGWTPQYDVASLQSQLTRVFNFEPSGQQPMEAGQVPRPSEPEKTATQAITTATPAPPATVETPAHQVSVPANPAVPPVQPEPASQVSMRSAYVNCNALKQLELYPTPALSPSPLVVLPCGEKVWAMSEQGGWAKVWTRQNVEGYALESYLTYGEPSLEQSPAEPPAEPDAQPDSSAPPVAPGPSVESAQPVAQPRTEPVPWPRYSSELPSRLALISGYLIFAVISIMVAITSRRSSEADVRLGLGGRREAADNAAPDREGATPPRTANGSVPADQYNQAACYLTGSGRKQNTRKAWSLLSRSARAGNKEAAAVLAAASAARSAEVRTARLDRRSPTLTILLAVVFTVIGCGIAAALMGYLGLWMK